LARGAARLSTADVAKLQAMFSEFSQSPAISAVLPLQIALGKACKPKPQQKFDSNTTVISTRCPSDCSTEDRDLLAKQLWSSVMNPSEGAVWASIRKQSSAKEKALLSGSSDAKAASPALQVSIPPPPGLAPDGREPTKIIGAAMPGQAPTCQFTKTSADAFFMDAEILGEENHVTTSLSSWLAQRCAQGEKMTCAQAAKLASSILSEADAAVSQHGSAALRAVQCDSIYLDKDLVPHLQPANTTHANHSWLSPEEAVGSAGAEAVWAALSYRIGLLLHCVAVSGSPDPYPDRSDDAVICGLLRAAKGCGEPEAPCGLGNSNGSSSRSSLMQNVISSCLRLSRPGPPDRRVVETSLAVISMQARISV